MSGCSSEGEYLPAIVSEELGTGPHDYCRVRRKYRSVGSESDASTVRAFVRVCRAGSELLVNAPGPSALSGWRYLASGMTGTTVFPKVELTTPAKDAYHAAAAVAMPM
jgi:hypothetical protein